MKKYDYFHNYKLFKVIQLALLVIFTIAGLFGGIFLGAAYFGMKYLFSGKITSSEYLKNLYGFG